MLKALFSDTPDGERRRRQQREIFDTLRRENQHADLDLGYTYAGSAVVTPDGTAAPPRDPDGTHYVPVARPGHRLPHAWLAKGADEVATHHLLRPGAFLLIAGSRGEPWAAAAQAVSRETGVAVDVVVLEAEGGLSDREGDWSRLRGHDDGGAVLVRPDGHVAFRAAAAAADAHTDLRAAVDVALGLAVIGRGHGDVADGTS
jgi:2,4-dichlorophenol 6-monooxygenase